MLGLAFGTHAAAHAMAPPSRNGLPLLDLEQFDPGSDYVQVSVDVVTPTGPSALCTDDTLHEYFDFSITSVMTLCDLATSNCDHFSYDANATEPSSGEPSSGSGQSVRGCLKKFAPLATPSATYLSRKSCGSKLPAPSLIDPSCSATSNYEYMRCDGGGGDYELLYTFALPPFLIQQACDGDDGCVGFVIDNPGQGSTIGLSSNPGDTYVKLDTQSPALPYSGVQYDIIYRVAESTTRLFKAATSSLF